MRTPEEIAEVCHEACRALQRIDGDPAPAEAWINFPDERRKVVIAGVQAVLQGQQPAQLHQAWLENMAADGWRYGPVKDPEQRTHPCMVAYEELPKHQRDKDVLFFMIVQALAGDPEQEWTLSDA